MKTRLKIPFYFSDKMKRRQTPIYSALIDVAISVPEVRSILVPSLPETISDNGIAPIERDGVANIPGSQDSDAHTLAAPTATEVCVSEPEGSIPTLTSASPVIRLSRTSHNFGQVLVGDHEYWILALHNEGENEGIIIDVSGLPLRGFSLLELPALPFTIPPHGSRVIPVRYAPDLAEHTAVACLSITTDDPDFTIQEVLLTGTGVTAPRNEAGFNVVATEKRIEAAKMHSQGTICPRCKQMGVPRRRPRKTWMRLIPFSKHFECGNCEARFLSIFGGITKMPLTRLSKAQGVVQTDLTFSTKSHSKERGHWSGKVRKSLTLAGVSLVILALSSFIIYLDFGGQALQEHSRKFLQFLRITSVPQDTLVTSEPKHSPEGELVSNSPNRTNLPKPEEKKEAPAILTDEGKSQVANIPAEVTPSPEQESLESSAQPSQIKIKKGETLSKIIAQHYPENQQVGLIAIMLANPEISEDYMIYAGQVIKLPQLELTDNIIKLQDSFYYGLYGRYYSENDLKKHTLWLDKINVKFIVRNAKDPSGRNVHLVILGGYEKKEDLKITYQNIKTKSE